MGPLGGKLGTAAAGSPRIGKANGDADVIPEEVIVAFKHGVSGSQRASVRRSQNATVKKSSPSLPGVQLLALPHGRSVSAAVKDFERSSLVRYAEPNAVVQGTSIPNDTDFSSQWGLNNTGQALQPFQRIYDTTLAVGTSDADIDAPEAWDVTTGSSSVTVAIVDSGIAYNHPDLAPNMWTNPGESGGGKETNGIDDDSDGYIDDWRGWDFTSIDNDPWDEWLHGTHVAGIAGAKGGNGYGVSGVSPQVRLMALRVLNNHNTGSAYDIAAAMAYAADRGAQIVNLSLGGRSPALTVIYGDVIRTYPGTLFIAGAGNDARNNDQSFFSHFYPCDVPEDNVICVAATDQNDQLASFLPQWGSNWGTTSVDLAAPGRDILNTSSVKVPWFDSFSTPITGRWATGGTNNTWAATTELGDGGSLTDSPSAYYLDNTDSYAERSANLSGFSACRLYYTADWGISPGDAATLELSDGSSPPTIAETFSGFYLSTGGVAIALLPPGLDGSSNATFRFRLTSDDDANVGDGIYIGLAFAACDQSTYGSDSFMYLEGTSMATPMVSGAAALLYARHPSASVWQVKDALLDSVDSLSSLNGKTVTGGRLNARGALDALDSIVTHGRIVVKLDAQPDDPQDFNFTAGGGLSPSSFSLDDDTDPTVSNTKTFKNLAPGGGYSIAQAGVPSGWDLSSATCDDGSPITNINVSAGEKVTCTFTNAKHGSIVVNLDTQPDNPQDFNFIGGGGLSPASFQLDDDGDDTNGLASSRTFSDLSPRSGYSVFESPLPASWYLAAAGCDDSSPNSNIDVSAGEVVTCTFTSTPVYNERPASADTLYLGLVPVFKQCGTGGNAVNSKHAPGLAVGSCKPPRPNSTQAYAGPDGSGVVSISSGWYGDVGLGLNDSDIQTSTGGDYDPTPGTSGSDLSAIFRIRLTDTYNCSPSPCDASYDQPGTGTDTDFGPIPIDCEANGDPSASPGSDCNLSTSANTIMPGMVVPGARAIWQVFRVRVLDGGGTLFQQQGLFSP